MIKKNAVCLSQSGISNFDPHVINHVNNWERLRPIVASGFGILGSIPPALGCSAYLVVCREEGALCVELLAFSRFFPSHPQPFLSSVYQYNGCLSSRCHRGSWLGYQILPAIGAVSIMELAANSGSSRMSQAPNLHIETQLFI